MPERNRLLFFWLPLALTAVVGLVAMISLANEVGDFFNPYLSWGAGYGGTSAVVPGGPCSTGAGATSETMPQAVLRLLMVQGGMQIATGLAVIGLVGLAPS